MYQEEQNKLLKKFIGKNSEYYKKQFQLPLIPNQIGPNKAARKLKLQTNLEVELISWNCFL